MIEHNRPPVRAQSPLFSRIYPAALRAGELACLKRRRQRARADGYGPSDPDVPPIEDGAEPGALPRDTVGLALSGGGIRSATFSLGFLQALAANGLLRHVDFLSTVSGGGYIGSFLGALIQRREPIAAGGLTGIARAEHDLRAPGAQPYAGCATMAAICLPMAPATRSSLAPCTCGTSFPFTSCWRRRHWCCWEAATLLHAVIDVNRPDLLPHWVAGGVHWSPFPAPPDCDAAARRHLPLGWGYWFILGDKNTPPSDLVAAWTAGLVACRRGGRGLCPRRRATALSSRPRACW